MNKYKPPKPGAGDVAHTIVKACLSSIPVLGSAASEVFALLVTPSLERRRVKWMEEVGQDLLRLGSEKGVRLEDLQNNEAFIDTLMAASQAAIRTASEQKRKALRNAILNSAGPGAPQAVIRQVFVELIDQLTEWHVKLLKQMHLYPVWRPYAGPVSHLYDNYPELRDRRDFFWEQAWRDLWFRGLVTTETLPNPPAEPIDPNPSKCPKFTTRLGDDFLRFIEEPW